MHIFASNIITGTRQEFCLVLSCFVPYYVLFVLLSDLFGNCQSSIVRVPCVLRDLQTSWDCVMKLTYR